jgi:hypothetical protein
MLKVIAAVTFAAVMGIAALTATANAYASCTTTCYGNTCWTNCY